MILNEILRPVASAMSQVETLIHQDVESDVALIAEISRYILNSGGKRLRPALVLMSAKLFDYAGPEPIQAAQVIEYLHTATLLHDDVVDHSDLRRSKKAARGIWGNQASVLVGDFLLALSFQRLTELNNLQVLATMSNATTLMAKGELLQLARAYDSFDQNDYLTIIEHKTASLFAAASKIGALFAGADEAITNALYAYGMAIGMAFQIVDDTLDYLAEETKLGKPLGTDLLERKITLPLIHLAKYGDAKTAQRLRDIVKAPLIRNEDVLEVIDMLKLNKSLSYSLEIARQYANQAQLQLLSVQSSSTKIHLHELSNFIVTRDI